MSRFAIVPEIIRQEDDRAVEFVLLTTDTGGSHYTAVTNAEISILHYANSRGSGRMLARFLQSKIDKKPMIERVSSEGRTMIESIVQLMIVGMWAVILGVHT